MKLRTPGRRSLRHVSIFLGSPGDVAAERRAARDVVNELLEHALLKGRISIDLVAWDRYAPMEGNADPQQAVTKWVGRPSQCDLTIILLSGRLGTPSGRQKPDGTPYRSGTEWELDDARRAKKTVFLYVRKNSPAPANDEQREQRQALAVFLQELDRARSARNDYESIEEFRELFKQHLQRFLRPYLEPGPWPWVAVAAAAAVAVYFLIPGRPTLKIDAVPESHILVRDLTAPSSPQSVRVSVAKSVADAELGDECAAQGSESPSFTGRHESALSRPDAVYEAVFPCDDNPWDFYIHLAERPRDAEWRGWVRITLRRGRRIFESEPVAVSAKLDDGTLTSVVGSAR